MQKLTKASHINASIAVAKDLVVVAKDTVVGLRTPGTLATTNGA